MGADFYIRTAAVSGYADVLRGEIARLREVAQALRAVNVEPTWFGRLPESGHLALAYERHRESELAELDASPGRLSAMADALDGNVARYTSSDTRIADAAIAVRG